MKSFFKISLFLISVVFISFQTDLSPNFIGKYAVSDDNPSQLELILNADQTFSFQDYSDSDNKISVQGNWRQKGSGIILTGNKRGVVFHNVWKFEQNGQVAKSRKGMTFYRLCRSAD